jgi:hypothetical protein
MPSDGFEGNTQTDWIFVEIVNNSWYDGKNSIIKTGYVRPQGIIRASTNVRIESTFLQRRNG